MTGFVYETQHAINPHITNYADALYFTVTALTTTGFGDITLPGTTGRLISVAIMIFGVTLFFGLARAVLRPAQGALPLPDLRPAAPRSRRGALQGVRAAAEHSERGMIGFAGQREPRASTLPDDWSRGHPDGPSMEPA